jgi:hypothetical protein
MPTRQDELTTRIFTDLEKLRDLANEAEDKLLVRGLSDLLADSLERYCEAKRKSLHERIEQARRRVA